MARHSFPVPQHLQLPLKFITPDGRARHMRLQFMVVGFNRSLEFCLPSINQKVINPGARLSTHSSSFFVISSSRQEVVNSWSGENGLPEFAIPKDVPADSSLLVDQEEIDAAVAAITNWVIRRRQMTTLQEKHIATNLVRYLWLLRRSYDFVDKEADYIVHVRPDLLFLDEMDFRNITRSHTGRPLKGIATANWGWQPNDRFALVSQKASDVYFRRFDRIEDFVNSSIEFSGESLLRFAMRGTQHRANLDVRAARVRLGGEVKNESFHRKKFHPSLRKKSLFRRLYSKARRLVTRPR